MYILRRYCKPLYIPRRYYFFGNFLEQVQSAGRQTDGMQFPESRDHQETSLLYPLRPQRLLAQCSHLYRGQRPSGEAATFLFSREMFEHLDFN